MSAMSDLQVIWNDSNLELASKKRLVNALILPISLYGCETWTLRAADERMINSFEMKMKIYRKMLNVKWQQHITNIKIKNVHSFR